MDKYYKIVSWAGFFRKEYKIEHLDAVAPGTRFVCQDPLDWCDVMLNYDPPVLHFACGAFDTLLWYDVFEEIASIQNVELVQSTCIYEVKPMSSVVYGKTRDEYRLFQYGASIIEFGKQISLSQIIKDAVKEYEQNKITKHIKYKHKMLNRFKSWQKYMQNAEQYPVLFRYGKEYC